jgi:hypothetical protein
VNASGGDAPIQAIRDSNGNARLKALYKEMVDASFGKEFLLPWFAAPTGRPDISK